MLNLDYVVGYQREPGGGKKERPDLRSKKPLPPGERSQRIPIFLIRLRNGEAGRGEF